MGPVFAHGQLRLYLLALLDGGPRHGYEIITALSDRFGGTYRPSPGTVYPRLARLEEEGLVRRSDDGRKVTYTLTDAGRAELAARSGDLAALESDLAESVRGLAAQVREDARGSMAGLRADLAAAAQQARAGARRAPSAAPPRADGRGSGTGWPDDQARERSTELRREAEELLTRFREEMKAELRRAEVRAGVEQLTVDTVRAVLDSARTAIEATLRR